MEKKTLVVFFSQFYFEMEKKKRTNRTHSLDISKSFTHGPELYEILQNRGRDEQTVDQRVGQEEDEELVVGEADAVVHPVDTKRSNTLGYFYFFYSKIHQRT